MAIIVAGSNQLAKESLLGSISALLEARLISVDEPFAASREGGAVRLVMIEHDAPWLDMADRVRAAFGGATKVAVYGGPDDGEQAVAWLLKGYDGYMPKCMSGAAVAHAAELILKGERYVPPVVVSQGRRPPTPKLPSAAAVLSPREGQILLEVATGASNKAIARALSIEEVTVKAHLKAVFRKLGVQSRIEAARFVLGPPPLPR